MKLFQGYRDRRKAKFDKLDAENKARLAKIKVEKDQKANAEFAEKWKNAKKAEKGGYYCETARYKFARTTFESNFQCLGKTVDGDDWWVQKADEKEWCTFDDLRCGDCDCRKCVTPLMQLSEAQERELVRLVEEWNAKNAEGKKDETETA